MPGRVALFSKFVLGYAVSGRNFHGVRNVALCEPEL